jgi:hypothetical protein
MKIFSLPYFLFRAAKPFTHSVWCIMLDSFVVAFSDLSEKILLSQLALGRLSACGAEKRFSEKINFYFISSSSASSDIQ